jgi:hypothetical protein
MGKKEIVESYEKVFLSFREPIKESRTSAKTRLVWFVGIAGYALLNAGPLSSAIAPHKLAGPSLLWLSLPWLLTALLGVVTHFLIDEAASRDDVFFAKKLAAIDLHRIAVTDGRDDPKEMLSIIDDTHPELKGAKQDTENWPAAARWLERATFAALVIGLFWAVIGPLLLA